MVSADAAVKMKGSGAWRVTLVGEQADGATRLIATRQRIFTKDGKAAMDAGAARGRASRPQCTALYKGWKRCEGRAISGGTLCLGHVPANVQAEKYRSGMQTPRRSRWDGRLSAFK